MHGAGREHPQLVAAAGRGDAAQAPVAPAPVRVLEPPDVAERLEHAVLGARVGARRAQEQQRVGDAPRVKGRRRRGAEGAAEAVAQDVAGRGGVADGAEAGAVEVSVGVEEGLLGGGAWW